MIVYLCLAHDSEHINSSLGRLRGQDIREGQEMNIREDRREGQEIITGGHIRTGGHPRTGCQDIISRGRIKRVYVSNRQTI